MISKVIKPARSFGRICRYLLDKREHAKVILSAGVRDYDYRKMDVDFSRQAAGNPGISKPVQHIILSFAPGEKIPEKQLVRIASEYLKALGIEKTQFVVVSHLDKLHRHIHIVLNRVGNDGKAISDSFLGLRGKKKAQELTRSYGLKPAVKKAMENTHPEQMNGYDQAKYEIYQAVIRGLTKARNFPELQEWLKKQGIGLVYKYKGQSNHIQGLSFKVGEFKYKASDIDRRFSYGKLSRLFALREQRNYRPSSLKTKEFINPAVNKGEDLLQMLLTPKETYELIPNELLKKNKRKRSKSKGL